MGCAGDTGNLLTLCYRGHLNISKYRLSDRKTDIGPALVLTPAYVGTWSQGYRAGFQLHAGKIPDLENLDQCVAAESLL